MHGLLSCTINTGVHGRAGGADVSLRDVTIAQDGKRNYTVQMTSRTGSAQRILGDLEKVELKLDTRREGLTFACSLRHWAGVARDGGGGDEKARIERLCLSLLMSKNL